MDHIKLIVSEIHCCCKIRCKKNPSQGIFPREGSCFVRIPPNLTEIGLCTVGVSKEGFADIQKGAGLIVAVGVGAVL